MILDVLDEEESDEEMEDVLDRTVDSLIEILASDKSTSDDFLLPLLLELVLLLVTFEFELEGDEDEAMTVESVETLAEIIDGDAAETLGAGDAAIGLKPDCIKFETVDVLIAARVAFSLDSRDIFLANFFSSLLCLEDFAEVTGDGLALISIDGKSGK